MSTKDELTAATLQDVITELQLGRAVSEDIKKTLIHILEGQSEIQEQQRAGLERANDQQKQIGTLERGNTDSQGKIRLLESRINAHATRLQKLEESPGRPSRAG